MGWLTDCLQKQSLEEATEGYLLGRGAKTETIEALHCVTWRPLAEPVADPLWREQTGRSGRGENLDGWLVVPTWSPRGRLLGFEARRMDKKEISRYLLPEAAWNPLWMGMHPAAMAKVWAGGDVWIVEGIFDLCPMEWVVPETDAVLGSGRAKLTPKQVAFLGRFCTGWVHVVYDNDETGKNGTHGWADPTGKEHMGAVAVLQRTGLRARAVPYSGGKDPGELWAKGGLPAVQRAFPM